MANKKTVNLGPCPHCGHETVRGSRDNTLEYKGGEITFNQPGRYCVNTECGEGFLNSDDMEYTNAAFRELKRQVDGILSADEVKVIRTRLGLSQREAGSIIGGGIQAFYKYESGKAEVSHPMSNLLRILDKRPELLEELREFSGNK